MASRSIGTLTAYITANSAQFMREFDKLDRKITRSSASFTKPGEKLALGFIGMENALKGVTKEIRYVIDNVENIPGIPAESVASIITMRKNLADARNFIDGMVAGIVSFGVQAAQSVGVAAAAVAGFNDTSSLSKLETPDEIARSKDPGFDDKMAAARKRLADARKGAAMAAADEAGQIKLLREEAERYDKFAKSSSINTVERLDAEREAFERRNQAESKMTAMRQKLAELDKKNAETMKDVVVASSMATGEEKLRDLQREANKMRADLLTAKSQDQNDPAVLQEQIQLRDRLEANLRRQIPLMEKEKQLAMEIGTSFSSAFESAILQAQSLGDALRSLAQDLLRLVLRQTVLQPLASGIAGFFQGLFTPTGSVFDRGAYEVASSLPKRAAGGPVSPGSSYLVGENGPEVLRMGAGAGYIMPNGASRGNGVTVNLTTNFASGVTRQEVAAMLPRMVEAAKSAVAEAVGRGGGYRRAFA